MQSPYYVYILHCKNDSLYTGITPNLSRRMRQHMGLMKGGAKYTAMHPPTEIAAVWTVPDRRSAAQMECAIKRLSSAQKRRLVQEPQLLHQLVHPEFPAVCCENFTLSALLT